MALPEGILEDIKDYLNINWQDEKTDKRITGYINRGMTRLQHIAGVSLDFTEEDLARSLLFDYCRYANSQALEVFEKNFESELLELNLNNQLKTPEKLIVVSATGAPGYTKISISPKFCDSYEYMYKTGTDLQLPEFFEVCDTVKGYTAWNGTDEIEAVSGDDILIVEIEDGFKAIRAGTTTVITG
ncbi:hypothetical protein [Sporanaerobacter sp. PP17-6a]|uniref:hypothetical protein n=1 Tax=Sporanaerobacter sp. PP17-6a TaxID=1891289 RepID=UPI00089FF083|nr:hypothetical protein [Sporanaerobacter sp. PP17-6a]SCL88013.1 hypothetical protein PP176A_1443 [Sporanaerobacter sp. PP17-6a]